MASTSPPAITSLFALSGTAECIGWKRLKTHELHVKSQKLKAESQKLKCNVELKPILTAGIHSLSSKAKAYATRPYYILPPE